MRKYFYLFLLVVVVVSCSKNSDDSNGGPCNPLTNSNNYVENITESTAIVYWLGEVIDNYEVEYDQSGFTVGSGAKRQVQNSTQVQLVGLLSGTEYDVYVRRVCSGERYSIYSNVIQFTTESTCLAPSFFSLGSTSSTSASFYWEANGETAWEIEYGNVGFTIGTGTVFQTSNGDAVISGLSPSTTYEFYIRANCGSQGYSNYVGPLVVTTDP